MDSTTTDYTYGHIPDLHTRHPYVYDVRCTLYHVLTNVQYMFLSCNNTIITQSVLFCVIGQ